MSNALPKAVQAQIDTANKIIEQMYKTPEQHAAEQEAADKAAAEKAAAEKAAAEKAAVKPEEKPDDTNRQAVETPTETPEEHRYKVLQGKYNKEVPRLNQQVRELSEQNRDYRDRLANAEAMIATLEEANKNPQVPAKLPLTQEEIEQFGPDLIDIIERVAGATVTPIVEKSFGSVNRDLQQVKQSSSNLQKTVAESKREKLFAAMDSAVPNWEVQNDDPEFLTWLEDTDPYSGQPRGELLTKAFEANNAERVVAIFNGFLNENRVVNDPAQTPAPEKKQESQKGLEKLVAPGGPKTGTTSAPESGKRKWTQADISALYDTKNEYIRRGKKVPAELIAAEKDLIKAQSEGRVFVNR